MTTLRLTGVITPEGELKVTLPKNMPAGEVEVTIQSLAEQSPIIAEEEDFTPQEIEELLTFEPTSGADVVAMGLVGGWEDLNIDDPVKFVEEIRRKAETRRNLPKW